MTENEKKAALELLQNVLKIPTVNGFSRETDLAEYLADYFGRFGIESEIQHVDDKRANIIVDIPGENPDVIQVWNGHLDTVPYGNLDEWSTDPAVPAAKDGRIYARGASDMKSGLAAMVQCICEMTAAGKKPSAGIRFIGTCDEEKGGQGALKVLEQDTLGRPALMLIGEPTDCSIGIAQKGCLWVKLTVRGKTSHGAYPDRGVNAARLGFEICSRFSKAIAEYAHELLKSPTAEITSVSGGIAPNMIPDLCEFTLDVRVVPGLEIDQALQILERICREFETQSENLLKTEVAVLNQRPPVSTDADNCDLITLKNIIERNGLQPELLGINYFTDASVFISGYADMPVLLFGPGRADMAHKPDEFVEIDKYYKAVDILKDFYSADLK